VASIAILAAVGLVGGAIAHAVLELDQASSGAVEMSESVRAIPDLGALVRQSDVVAVVRVLDGGTVRIQDQPVATPAANPPPPQSNPIGKSALPTPLPAVQQQGQISVGRPQTPMTVFRVEVERAVRGNATAGEQLSVVQAGGPISVPVVPGGPVLTRTVQIEDERLMQEGERNVVFLKRAPDGTFFITGQAQGRLTVDAAGKVHAVNPGAPATHTYDGQALDDLLVAVMAIR
jgi:hypothetical protein